MKKNKTETIEKEQMGRIIKRNIEDRRDYKHKLSLPPVYEDNRTIEFTQGEVDDLQEELENKSEKKFSISLLLEYVEILDDIAKRDSKKLKPLKFTRNNLIEQAIKKYIRDRGYIVTKEILYFQYVTELEPLMALCKDAKKLHDFPAWVRGYWIRSDSCSSAEYIGNVDDKDVDNWFREIFEKMRERRKSIEEKSTL